MINLHEEPLRVSKSKFKTELGSFRHTVISGPQSTFFMGEMPSNASVIGIHFKPGGAYPFLGLPASELLNSFELSRFAVGHPCSYLTGETTGGERRKPEVSDSRRVSYDADDEAFVRLNPAVRLVLDELHWASKSQAISKITERIGMSQKHLIQIFKKEVGMTPKLFYRIQRFQRVLRLTRNGQCTAWKDFCLECGYYDQAHLIHDFRTFSGCTPTDYLKHKSRASNHVSVQE